ncbi:MULTISPECIES: DUF885 domain-containing protein [unclassified Sphingomonas]|uniref:DUF885 domain-containing protein n=1 Tax=unclassified Sphingomonas TaxID=196159 RepID=UPI0006F7B09A|nr:MULTISPECIES: DUF885 family protein [unclassified Sphingomonas]KQX20727.1 Tat pathway signal protein [Sphingomonas sp. Root1294]KQY68574.1 Tat pathway signal protein [Sphingomonas sp. Root50]KRB87980.1 Tat pathway signal protein [Sphingomonas sp. Root720]
MDRRQFIGWAGLALLVGMMPRLAQAAAGNPADRQLAAMVEDLFRKQIDRSPETATSLGLDKGEHAARKTRLDIYTKADQARSLAEDKLSLAALRKLDRAAMSPGAQLNYDVVVYMYDQRTKGGAKYSYGSTGGYFAPYAISQLSGPYSFIPDFLDSQHVIETRADADAYLARLHEFARVLDESTRFQQDDVRFGVFAPDFCLDLALGQLRALRDQPAAGTVLVESIVRRTGEKNIAGDWGAEAGKIVAAEVFPALDRQIALVAGLRKAAVHDAGCWRLPKGDEYYADALMNATTTTLSPEEVHRMGLEQVAEISGQIDAILRTQGMTKGSVGERLTALNNDPKQLFANTDAGRAELIDYINGLVKAMDAKLPQAFATLPKAPLEVKRVPPFIQDGAPNGYYNSAALDGSRGAIYYINLKDTADWPRYGLPSLTYHEGTPGHHLQISLAQEAKDLPMLRKIAPFGAYVEGWALYAEQLADEMGVYAGDPIGRVGFLQSFLFRAVRLVTDTGIHYKRWSREQATDYMVAASGFARPRTQREVDRYCVWPGQACSYKVGHMSWIKAREKAKAIQGAKFDLRQFHQVLLEGALPLTILEQLVEARARG